MMMTCFTQYLEFFDELLPLGKRLPGLEAVISMANMAESQNTSVAVSQVSAYLVFLF